MSKKVEPTNLHALVEKAWKTVEPNKKRFDPTELRSLEQAYTQATEDDRLNAAAFLKSNGVAPTDIRLARNFWKYYRNFDATYSIAETKPERMVIPEDAYNDPSRPLAERLTLYEIAAHKFARSKSVLHRFSFTYGQLLREKPRLGGTLLIEYNIASDGSVSKARVVPKHQAGIGHFTSTFGDVETSLVMIKIAERIKFPPTPEGKQVSFVARYSFLSLEK